MNDKPPMFNILELLLLPFIIIGYKLYCVILKGLISIIDWILNLYSKFSKEK